MTRPMTWALGLMLVGGPLGCGKTPDETGGDGGGGGGGVTQPKDRDGDGVTDDQDCAPDSREAWRQRQVYVDGDGDQYGSGEVRSLCVGESLPPGFATEAGDCAPTDSSRWKLYSYSWRDQDRDGAFVAEKGEVCGGFALSAGYATAPSAVLDCDDTRAEVSVSWQLFPDEDGDDVGAGTRTTLCAGPTRPAGYASEGTDCAPTDASRWQSLSRAYRDADGDGYTVDFNASVCLGRSSPEYPDTSRGPDCDDTRAAVFQALSSYVDRDGDGEGAGQVAVLCTNGSRPSGYVASGNDCDDTNPAFSLWRVLYPDRDGDGVGAAPRAVLCLDAATLPPGRSIYGFDPDDTDASVREDPEADATLFEPKPEP